MLTFDARTARILDAIARLGSVSAAARELGLDASNTLRHLRTAERRAGAHLVARARGGAERGAASLTPAGRAVLGEAESDSWVASAGMYVRADGVTPLTIGHRVLYAAGHVRAGPVRVTFRPEDVSVERPREGARRSSVRNAFAARISGVDARKEGIVTVHLVAGALRFSAHVTRGAVRELRLREGSRVIATLKATAVRATPLTGA